MACNFVWLSSSQVARADAGRSLRGHANRIACALAISTLVLFVACDGSAADNSPEFEGAVEAEATEPPSPSVVDETAGQSSQSGEASSGNAQAYNVRDEVCWGCIAREARKAEDAFHLEVSEADRACGLREGALDFNTRNDPAIDFDVLYCLEESGSHRTSWKAFLYFVHLSERSESSCLAARAADIAFRNSNIAQISTFGLEPEKYSGYPFIPFSGRYRLVGLEKALGLFSQNVRGDVSGLAVALNDCADDLHGEGVVKSVSDLAQFLGVGSRYFRRIT